MALWGRDGWVVNARESFGKAHGPAYAFIFDLWPPELWEILGF